ncbi:MAG: hypothetical protein QOI84_1503 [Solirubrobacterales bacterium]|jgi:hypothetical protein|nr:hypothetical protein [Solirubrobacterales bacterium]
MVRIFAMPKESVELPRDTSHAIFGRPIFACLKATGKSWLLNVPASKANAIWLGVDEDALAIHLPRVAYVFTDYYFDSHSTWIRVRDLRSGAITRSCPAGGALAPSRLPLISDLVLNGKGSVAWSVTGGRFPSGNAAVVACDSSGQRTLDSGEGIDLESVSIQNSVVTWLDNGTQREAWLE